MGTYNIPRNTKGEGRILYIFSTKALAYTGVGIAIGWVIYFILKSINLTEIGLFFIVLFGSIGFAIATFKVPNFQRLEISRKTAGENLDEVIKRYIKFKMKKIKGYSLYKGGKQ